MLMLLLLLTISLWRCHRFVYLPQSRAWEMQFSARPMWQRVDARPQSRTANTDRWYSSVAVRSVAAAGPWSKTIAEPRKCPWNSDRASFAAGNSRRHPVQGWKGGRERERGGVNTQSEYTYDIYRPLIVTTGVHHIEHIAHACCHRHVCHGHLCGFVGAAVGAALLQLLARTLYLSGGRRREN